MNCRLIRFKQSSISVDQRAFGSCKAFDDLWSYHACDDVEDIDAFFSHGREISRVGGALTFFEVVLAVFRCTSDRRKFSLAEP